MPESNHEVIIDGYVYPDTVTITLANDDFVGSRDYVSKDLYESVDSANDYWQAENAKLRDALKALVMGTYAELCTGRDQPQCRECSMRRGDDTCVTADAMELLGIDMYGEPMGGIK